METIHKDIKTLEKKDSEQIKLTSFFEMLKRHTDKWNPIKNGLSTKYEDRTDQKEAIQGFKNEWNDQAKNCMEKRVEIPSVVIDSKTTKGLKNSVVDVVCKEKTIDMSDMIFGDFAWASDVMKDCKLKFDNSKFNNFTAFGVSNDAGISFYNATFKEKAKFIHVSVNDIDFIGASFFGKTSFFDCEFKGRFNIQWALINTVIEFMNTEFFTDATFGNINFSLEESFINELFDNNKFKEKYGGLIYEDELYEFESPKINKESDTAELFIKNEKNQKKTLSISNKTTTDGKFTTNTLEIKMDNKVISNKLRGCYKVDKNFSISFKKVKFKNDFRLGDIYNLKNLYLDDVIVKGTSSVNSKITNCPDFSTCFFEKKYHIIDCESWREQPTDPNQLNEAAYRWLKNYYNQQNDHERELQYFKLEMEAKYKNLSNGLHKFVFWLYRLFSNLGNNYLKPLVCFFVISLAFYALGYSMEILVEVNCFKEFFKILDEKLTWLKLRKFSKDLLNGMIPFLGINNEIDKWYEIIVRLLSFPFLFLFGLGLRNRFKLR